MDGLCVLPTGHNRGQADIPENHQSVLPKVDVPVRTYEIEYDDTCLVRVDLPENWKVTFGPVVGSDKTTTGRTMAFRAWESETKQRLLLTGVRSFRDLSIPVTVRAIRPFGWPTWHMETEHWFRPEDMEKVECAWKPIEEVSDRDIKPADLLKANEREPDEDDDGVNIPKALSWREPVTRKRRI